MLQYKKVPLKNKEDYIKAEKLQAQGWMAILSGFDYVLFERERKQKRG